MSGINATGKPNTSDYIVGRGRVYLARLDANGYPQEYRELGNAPTFKCNVSTTILEHASSRHGLKVIDEQVVTQQKLSLSLELDEINFDNLAIFLAGDAAAYGNTAAASAIVADATAGNLLVYKKGCWYDLYKSTTGQAGNTADVAGGRLYDVGTLTVKSLDNMTTYTLGTDYEVDLKQGRIFIRSDSTMTADPTTPVHYRIGIAANAGADQAPSQVQGLTKTVIAGALKFIMENPANSDQEYEFNFWKVQLSAEGDLALISDDFTKLSLKGDAQSNAAASPNSPIVTVRLQKNAHA